MPDMADITVKKYDGTTDIVHSKINASGADGSDAVWRQVTGNGNPMGLQPIFKARSRYGSGGKARILETNGIYPAVYTDTTTGLKSSNGSVRVKVMISVDTGIDANSVAEGVHQLLNLNSSALIKSCGVNGSAPT